MWQSLLAYVLRKLFDEIGKRFIGPWLRQLQENRNFRLAMELAEPLILMAERGELSEILEATHTKWQAVYENLVDQLGRQGVELKQHLINDAIETVITALTAEGVINKGD